GCFWLWTFRCRSLLLCENSTASICTRCCPASRLRSPETRRPTNISAARSNLFPGARKCWNSSSAADFSISARNLSAAELPASTRLERKPTNKHPGHSRVLPSDGYGRCERGECED